jgi:oleate hydratase
MMPYVTSFFLPRKAGDRPDVIPKGAQNFAFLGQFAETGRDCIFTTEYSVRTGMEATYALLGVERGIPETFASTYDVRALLKAAAVMRDGEPLTVPGPQLLAKKLLERLADNEIGKLLEEAGLL